MFENIKKSASFKSISFSLALIVALTTISFYLFYRPLNSYANITNLSLEKIKFENNFTLGNYKADLPLLKAIVLDPDNPLQLSFYLDSDQKRKINDSQIDQLIKYFLGFLAISEDRLWVNLSPYESQKIIPQDLAKLDIGKDMLLEDYLLKQLSSYVTHPDTVIGKRFWQEVNRVVKTTTLPINTLFKIWISPDIAQIYEYSQAGKTIGVIKQARLKVSLEEDKFKMNTVNETKVNQQVKQLFRQQLLPVIQRQVNESIDFAPLRQLYYSFILASYFKRKLAKDSFYKHYINRSKTQPINLADSTIKDKVYQQYLNKFKQGVYNHLRKEYNQYSKRMVLRHYYSGGVNMNWDFTNSQGLNYQPDPKANLQASLNQTIRDKKNSRQIDVELNPQAQMKNTKELGELLNLSSQQIKEKLAPQEELGLLGVRWLLFDLFKGNKSLKDKDWLGQIIKKNLGFILASRLVISLSFIFIPNSFWLLMPAIILVNSIFFSRQHETNDKLFAFASGLIFNSLAWASGLFLNLFSGSFFYSSLGLAGLLLGNSFFFARLYQQDKREEVLQTTITNNLFVFIIASGLDFFLNTNFFSLLLGMTNGPKNLHRYFNRAKEEKTEPEKDQQPALKVEIKEKRAVILTKYPIAFTQLKQRVEKTSFLGEEEKKQIKDKIFSPLEEALKQLNRQIISLNDLLEICSYLLTPLGASPAEPLLLYLLHNSSLSQEVFSFLINKTSQDLLAKTAFYHQNKEFLDSIQRQKERAARKLQWQVSKLLLDHRLLLDKDKLAGYLLTNISQYNYKFQEELVPHVFKMLFPLDNFRADLNQSRNLISLLNSKAINNDLTINIIEILAISSKDEFISNFSLKELEIILENIANLSGKNNFSDQVCLWEKKLQNRVLDLIGQDLQVLVNISDFDKVWLGLKDKFITYLDGDKQQEAIIINLTQGFVENLKRDISAALRLKHLELMTVKVGLLRIDWFMNVFRQEIHKQNVLESTKLQGKKVTTGMFAMPKAIFPTKTQEYPPFLFQAFGLKADERMVLTSEFTDLGINIHILMGKKIVFPHPKSEDYVIVKAQESLDKLNKEASTFIANHKNDIENIIKNCFSSASAQMILFEKITNILLYCQRFSVNKKAIKYITVNLEKYRDQFDKLAKNQKNILFTRIGFPFKNLFDKLLSNGVIIQDTRCASLYHWQDLDPQALRQFSAEEIEQIKDALKLTVRSFKTIIPLEPTSFDFAAYDILNREQMVRVDKASGGKVFWNVPSREVLEEILLSRGVDKRIKIKILNLWRETSLEKWMKSLEVEEPLQTNLEGNISGFDYDSWLATNILSLAKQEIGFYKLDNQNKFLIVEKIGSQYLLEDIANNLGNKFFELIDEDTRDIFLQGLSIIGQQIKSEEDIERMINVVNILSQQWEFLKDDARSHLIPQEDRFLKLENSWLFETIKSLWPEENLEIITKGFIYQWAKRENKAEADKLMKLFIKLLYLSELNQEIKTTFKEKINYIVNQSTNPVESLNRLVNHWLRIKFDSDKKPGQGLGYIGLDEDKVKEGIISRKQAVHRAFIKEEFIYSFLWCQVPLWLGKAVTSGLVFLGLDLGFFTIGLKLVIILFSSLLYGFSHKHDFGYNEQGQIQDYGPMSFQGKTQLTILGVFFRIGYLFCLPDSFSLVLAFFLHWAYDQGILSKLKRMIVPQDSQEAQDWYKKQEIRKEEFINDVSSLKVPLVKNEALKKSPILSVFHREFISTFLLCQVPLWAVREIVSLLSIFSLNFTTLVLGFQLGIIIVSAIIFAKYALEKSSQGDSSRQGLRAISLFGLGLFFRLGYFLFLPDLVSLGIAVSLDLIYEKIFSAKINPWFEKKPQGVEGQKIKLSKKDIALDKLDSVLIIIGRGFYKIFRFIASLWQEGIWLVSSLVKLWLGDKSKKPELKGVIDRKPDVAKEIEAEVKLDSEEAAEILPVFIEYYLKFFPLDYSQLIQFDENDRTVVIPGDSKKLGVKKQEDRINEEKIFIDDSIPIIAKEGSAKTEIDIKPKVEDSFAKKTEDSVTIIGPLGQNPQDQSQGIVKAVEEAKGGITQLKQEIKLEVKPKQETNQDIGTVDFKPKKLQAIEAVSVPKQSVTPPQEEKIKLDDLKSTPVRLSIQNWNEEEEALEREEKEKEIREAQRKKVEVVIPPTDIKPEKDEPKIQKIVEEKALAVETKATSQELKVQQEPKAKEPLTQESEKRKRSRTTKNLQLPATETQDGIYIQIGSGKPKQQEVKPSKKPQEGVGNKPQEKKVEKTLEEVKKPVIVAKPQTDKSRLKITHRETIFNIIKQIRFDAKDIDEILAQASFVCQMRAICRQPLKDIITQVKIGKSPLRLLAKLRERVNHYYINQNQEVSLYRKKTVNSIVFKVRDLITNIEKIIDLSKGLEAVKGVKDSLEKQIREFKTETWEEIKNIDFIFEVKKICDDFLNNIINQLDIEGEINLEELTKLREKLNVFLKDNDAELFNDRATLPIQIGNVMEKIVGDIKGIIREMPQEEKKPSKKNMPGGIEFNSVNDSLEIISDNNFKPIVKRYKFSLNLGKFDGLGFKVKRVMPIANL